MIMHKYLALIVAAICIAPALAKAEPLRHTIKFETAESVAVGPVEKLVVTVSCGWVVALREVPELYNIEMEYDMPTENVLEARPRLGAAAVSLKRWSGVITVTGDRSCFGVTVRAEGRKGLLDLNTKKLLSRK